MCFLDSHSDTKTDMLLIKINWFWKYKKVWIIKRREEHPTMYYTSVVSACSMSILPSSLWIVSPLFPEGSHPSFCMWSVWDCWSWCPAPLVTKWTYDLRHIKETLILLRLGRMTPEQKPGRSDSPLRRYPRDRIFQFLLPGASELSSFLPFPRFGYSNFPWILQTTPCPSNKLFYWLN